MKSGAGAEHVATLQTRKGLEALEPKCCGLCCTAGATLAGSRQKKVCLFLCSVKIFWSARKAIPSQCLCSWQLATEAQSITRLTPFKNQPAGIELDGTYNKQQNENNKQQAVGITS